MQEQTPGTNLRISLINIFLTIVGQHAPLKINMGFTKGFFGEDAGREFRTTLTSMGSWDQATSQQTTEKKKIMHHGPFEDVTRSDMSLKAFPSIRLSLWQGNALASAEQPPVAAPLGWEAVKIRWPRVWCTIQSLDPK